jgi:hypothetical protein
MFTRLSSRVSLFLHVRTHPQLQYYLRLKDTGAAANQNGIADMPDPIVMIRKRCRVVDIHPIGGAQRQGR